MKSYPITPVPKPRMTKSDAWKKRPCVMRYWAFKDKVRELGIELICPCKITFYVPMPKSWSKKKKTSFDGRPHLNETFDVDNGLKGLMDAIYDQDGHIWSIAVEKRWAHEGSITIEKFPEDVYLP